MKVASIHDEEDGEIFSSLLTKDHIGRIGKEGYYTIGAYDEEDDLAAGILQFYVGMDAKGMLQGRVVDLIVDPFFSSKEITTQLVDNLMLSLEQSSVKIARVDMADRKEYYDLLDAVRSIGFVRKEDYLYYRATLREYLAGMERSEFSFSNEYHSISDFGSADFSMFLQEIAKRIPYGIQADLSRNIDAWDPVSSCYYKYSDGSGMLLFERSPSGALQVKLLRGYGNDVKNRLHKLSLFAAYHLKKFENKKTLISFACKTPETKALAAALFKGITPVKMRGFVGKT